MDDFRSIRELYHRQLVESVLPFWLKHGMDKVHGGIYTGLDRDGSLIETDKSVWFQGRALWVFCTAYEQIDKNPAYLEAATSLANFLVDHCFDTDGRMFFRVTADGRPVIKRIRYYFSETFAVIGFATYARITGKKEWADRAYKLMEKVEEIKKSGVLVPKFNQENEPSIGFGGPMIMLNVLSELRSAFPAKTDSINRIMDGLLKEVETYYVRDDLQLVLEQCAPDGSLMGEHFEGRLLNPGHAIEGSWFIMNEGIYRNDDHLKQLGLKMLDWMWKVGWDEECGGGIIQYRDALGKAPTEYWHDMKFWWPQCEAAIANLMAYSLTKDEKYKTRFFMVNDYIQARFPDPEYGEWFGYFHRDGTRSTVIKGNMYKGPFHVPRMYMKCIELIDGMEKQK
jgi:N-acylglucosamine 2-epimerase